MAPRLEGMPAARSVRKLLPARTWFCIVSLLQSGAKQHHIALMSKFTSSLGLQRDLAPPMLLAVATTRAPGANLIVTVAREQTIKCASRRVPTWQQVGQFPSRLVTSMVDHCFIGTCSLQRHRACNHSRTARPYRSEATQALLAIFGLDAEQNY